MTPYVARLFEGVEEAIRRSLGLKPNVRIEHRPARPGNEAAVDFRVHLPNSVTLEMRLAPPDSPDFALARSEHISLISRQPPGGDDSRQDPMVDACLATIGRLFRAQQRLDGAQLTRHLMAQRSEVRDFAQLSDDFYVRIFDGVMGAAANLRLGFRCNQSCGFCWQGRQWPEPPPEMLLTWLDEIGAADVKQLSITGGEPTLHRALPGLLQRAREIYGMRIMLQTNAIQLRKPKVLSWLVEGRVDRLFVSFHSADPALSDRMTKAPGTHQATVEGIEAALLAGIPTSLNCVVERANYRALSAHAQFIVDRFVAPFPDNPVGSVSYSRPQAYHDRALFLASMVPMDEVEAHLLEAVEILRDAGVVLDLTAGSCGLPACLFRACPELICLPEPSSVGMADPAFDERARDQWACARCALRQRCQGPGADYFQTHGDRGLVPFTEMPTIAERYPLSLGEPVRS